MGSLWHRNPVVVLAFVQAGIALAISFGFHASGEQMAAIMAFANIGIALLTNSQIITVTGAAASSPAVQLAAQAQAAEQAAVETAVKEVVEEVK